MTELEYELYTRFRNYLKTVFKVDDEKVLIEEYEKIENYELCPRCFGFSLWCMHCDEKGYTNDWLERLKLPKILLIKRFSDFSRLRDLLGKKWTRETTDLFNRIIKERYGDD